jgi:hypothetical protein
MFRKVSFALIAAAAVASTALAPTSASAWGRGGGFRDGGFREGGFHREWRGGGAIGISISVRAGAISTRMPANDRGIALPIDASEAHTTFL